MTPNTAWVHGDAHAQGSLRVVSGSFDRIVCRLTWEIVNYYRAALLTELAGMISYVVSHAQLVLLSVAHHSCPGILLPL